MSAIPLSNDETVAIFVEPTHSDLAGLDSTEREQFLKRVLELLDSATPSHYVEKAFSNCDELQQLRAGNYLRGYCRLVMDVDGYNVLFVFHVTKHRYRELRLYDERACERVAELMAEVSDGNVESYLESRDALTAVDVREILDA